MEIKNIINDILQSNSLENKQDIIFECIPELKDMVGFEHRHPHHYLDVWGHTLLVVKNLNDIDDLELKMAGLLHDIGKPFSYQDEQIRHFHGHPEVSEKMAFNVLNRLGYEEDFISNVCYLVKKHDTPIDVDNLDNTYEMINKLLILQYADARAHNPEKIKKRTEFLDQVKKQLEEKNKEFLKSEEIE